MIDHQLDWLITMSAGPFGGVGESSDSPISSSTISAGGSPMTRFRTPEVISTWSFNEQQAGLASQQVQAFDVRAASSGDRLSD